MFWGGVPEAIDTFTADGDYYNDGSSNQPVIVYGGGGTSGTGWVSNGSVSTSTSSDNKYKSDDILDLNDAINLAKDGVLYSSDTKVNSALSDVDNLLRINPDWGDAKTVKEILERYLELKNNLIPSLEKEISSIEAKIAELTRQIAEQEKVVAEKKAIVDEKQKILDEYDKELADLEGKIKAGLASDAEKAEYQRLLVEREQAFADWQAAMDAYNKALQKLNELIAEKEFYESLLATKKSLLEQYKQELEDLKQQITKIKSSGYRDAPYTQRWLVKDGTPACDAYDDIVQYLKPNQTYKFTGKFGDQYYYEEDEAELTITYGPYEGEDENTVLIHNTLHMKVGSSAFGDGCDYGGEKNGRRKIDGSGLWYYDGGGTGFDTYVKSLTSYGGISRSAYSLKDGLVDGRHDTGGSVTHYDGNGGFYGGNMGNSSSGSDEWGSGAYYTHVRYLFRIRCNRPSMNRDYVCEVRNYSLRMTRIQAPYYWNWSVTNCYDYDRLVASWLKYYNTRELSLGKVNWLGSLPKVDIVLSANGLQYIQASDTD